LHAGLVVPGGQRERLERICRYALRPPVTQERLHLTGDGQVRLELRHPWRDGTTEIVFDPVEFLGRLAVLVPRPRINLILYHGVLGPRAVWRSEVVRRERSSENGRDAALNEAPTAQGGEADTPDAARRRARGQCWAALMRRTFGLDVLACPRCGGRLRLIALIEEAAVIERILRHFGVPTEIPVPRPARAPAVIGRVLRHLGVPTEIPPPCPARAPPLRAGASDQAGWDDETAVFTRGS
jgi:uncharacterized protein YbaR (Trm112 family)